MAQTADSVGCSDESVNCNKTLKRSHPYGEIAMDATCTNGANAVPSRGEAPHHGFTGTSIRGIRAQLNGEGSPSEHDSTTQSAYSRRGGAKQHFMDFCTRILFLKNLKLSF